ncbi:MAG: metallophosphoesterase [Verrucomicrobiales bacterium]|nr:metallophosphoesterase [Verrucomicrobiales bacterium]
MTAIKNPKSKSSALVLGIFAAAISAEASGDYGPAVWRPCCNGKWYTTGNGKKFYVEHDMEGYYLSAIAYLNQCGVSASVHYAVNGKQDTGSDAPPGEVSQMVADIYYAWHASCWNQSSMGTEHEGFANNPAWYTEAMYQASALLTRAKADKYGFAKDRNHIVGHGEKANSAWASWAGPNLGINAYCNTHTDPGPYWDWNHFMALITPASRIATTCDFNGDHKTDLVFYRPSTGEWADLDGFWVSQWGQAGDIPIPGDYNNWVLHDGASQDIVVFRPSTREWISRDGWTAQWGQPGDIPVPADYDNDKVTDICTYSPSTGNWWKRGGWGFGIDHIQWGGGTYVPVPGDYNGDGWAEIWVFDPGPRNWIPLNGTAIQWGQVGDIPVPGCYVTPGKTEICTYNRTTGMWYLRNGWSVQWGQPGDIPVPGDYDGDGRDEIAVWRPSTGDWFVYGKAAVRYGTSTDRVMQLPYAIRRLYWPNN